MPGRLDDSATRDLILELLAGEFVSIRLVAEAVERTPELIRAKHFKPLLDEGRIIAKYPENPSHPEQAYKLALPNHRQ
ncbi:hypothetical protein EEB15_22885 [Ramlibacter sp. WS9]|nr:hypothetical protein EEB15_22885 [Ramlibacter sp. WS9]